MVMVLTAINWRVPSIRPSGRLVMIVVVLVLCVFLPLQTLAQFTEIYPFVKTAVAVDSTETTMYFTHASTNVINAVMLRTGVEMTYSVNASLSRPSGLATDSTGSLLIADTGNHRIVRLNTTTGELTAVYETSSPALQWPCDIAVGVDDVMWVADTWNHRIVRLSPQGHQLPFITALFSAPSLHYPAGVSLDSAGRVFIADTGNDRIVQMSAEGEQMAVYVTNGPSLRAPLSVAIHFDGSLQPSIFIADSGNDRVVKLSVTGVQLSEYQLNNPSLSYPSGLVVTPGSELYVADSGINRITRLRPTVVFDEYYTQSPSLANPTGVAVDAADDLLVVDWANRRLVKLRSANDIVAVYAPPLLNASRMALDAAGHLFVSDLEGSIVKLSAAGAPILPFTTDNPPLSSPQGVTLNAADELFVADTGNNRIVRLNATGALLAVYNTSSPALKEPLDVAVDTGGCLYIVDSGNNRVIKLNATDGTLLYVFTTAKPALNRPTAVTLDAFGRLYIVDSGNSRVVKLSERGGMLAVYGNSTSLLAPTAVTLDAAGNVVVVDSASHRVVLFEVHAMFMYESYEPSLSLLRMPLTVAVGSSDGAMYIAAADNRITKRSRMHVVVHVFIVRGAVDPELAGIVLDADDTIYALDTANNCIVKLSSTGTQLDVLTVSNPALNGPSGLTLHAGSLFIADYNNQRLVKLSMDGVQLAEYEVNMLRPPWRGPYPSPSGIALDASGHMYLSDFYNGCILKLAPNGTRIVTFTTSSPSLKMPSTIMMSADGALFVAGQRSNHTNITHLPPCIRAHPHIPYNRTHTCYLSLCCLCRHRQSARGEARHGEWSSDGCAHNQQSSAPHPDRSMVGVGWFAPHRRPRQ